MSSSAKGRVIRAARSEDDVFVLGESARRDIPADSTIASVANVLAAAERRAQDIVAEGERRAATIVASAGAEAAAARNTGFAAGFLAGQADAAAEATAALDLIRRAAAEGKAIRDEIAGQAAGVIARAVSLALRRVVGEYYEADPERTAAACADALRAAAGQEILAIRVHSGLVHSVQASLGEAAAYIRPDDAVETGGCIIDLRNGTLDASLDARLTLMELALREAGGEAQR